MIRERTAGVALFLVLFGWVAVQDSGWGQSPASGFVTVHGHPYYERDLIFMLDGSASQGSGPFPPSFAFEALETAAALAQLEPSQRFNVIVYSGNAFAFETGLVDATPDNIADAVDWMQQYIPSGVTCPGLAAFPVAFDQLMANPGVNEAILCWSDGTINCGSPMGHVDSITADNVQGVPIHTFFRPVVGGSRTAVEQLALQNGGTFVDTGQLVFLDFYRRGDSNNDGATNLSDAVFLLQHLFLQGPAPTCPDAADTDDSDSLELTDAMHLLAYLFLQGPPPPFPGPDICGVWTAGALGVCAQPGC